MKDSQRLQPHQESPSSVRPDRGAARQATAQPRPASSSPVVQTMAVGPSQRGDGEGGGCRAEGAGCRDRAAVGVSDPRMRRSGGEGGGP